MGNKKQTVFMAMSGGVDSAVSAALLKQAGYQVVGIFMKNWSEDIEGVTFCSTQADFADVRAVCAHLDIPYYAFNFEAEYKKRVLDYFFKEYKAGRTPNPDIMCNKEIKFGLFFERAISLGADLIATGHYAQSIKTKGGYQLKTAVDKTKDQTYFLYQISTNQLSRTLFPIGGYTKKQVRELAKKLKLPVATKKDSQGICFIGHVDVKKFLKTAISTKKGKIVNLQGETLGEHEGAWFYTVGQRRIEGLSGTKNPMYVVATDIKKNQIVVGEEADIYSSVAILENLHLINPGLSMSDLAEKSILAKSRYTPEFSSGYLQKTGKTWQFTFDKPERAITSGQSLVLYDKDICIGGGVIARS